MQKDNSQLINVADSYYLLLSLLSVIIVKGNAWHSISHKGEYILSHGIKGKLIGRKYFPWVGHLKARKAK